MAGEAKVLGAGRSIVRLPSDLAALHRELGVGEHIRVQLSPRPSRAWFAERARDLIVGAGFQLQGRCIFRNERATANIERIQSLPDSVGPGMEVLIVGLNPSPYSADSGIPYGRPGNRFWPAALGFRPLGFRPCPLQAYAGRSTRAKTNQREPRRRCVSAPCSGIPHSSPTVNLPRRGGFVSRIRVPLSGTRRPSVAHVGLRRFHCAHRFAACSWELCWSSRSQPVEEMTIRERRVSPTP